MDLLLSKTVSLPTSSRPICFGSTLYFLRSDVTAVRLKFKQLERYTYDQYQHGILYAEATDDQV